MRMLSATVISATVLVGFRIVHLLPVTTSTIPLGVLAMDFVLGLVGAWGLERVFLPDEGLSVQRAPETVSR
jgi:hypothetical protein